MPNEEFNLYPAESNFPCSPKSLAGSGIGRCLPAESTFPFANSLTTNFLIF